MAKKEDNSTLPEKWLKVVNKMPEFKDQAEAASVEELKKIIVESEGNIYNEEQKMSQDTQLNAAKELCKDYSAIYREAIKFQTARVKYALFLLEGKGVEIGEEED